ncbi:MAG: amidohydrolase, partial [Chloroflexi bacterium]|nr:amidohydrolase [Chloroflexota bacterium]
VQDLNGRHKRVIAAVPGYQTNLRRIEVPNVKGMDAKVVIPNEARRIMGISTGNSRITWHHLPGTAEISRWLVVSATNRSISSISAPATGAGLAMTAVELRPFAVARAANNHFAADYGGRTKRLRPVGVLPLQDPPAAAAELRRAVTELGLVSFELLSTGLRLPLGDTFYDPLYAEAERLGVPLCIHGTRGNAQDVGGHLFRTFSEVHCYTFPASVILQFTSIFFNAVPVRFPKLKLAFLEIGASWLPYYLPRMDEHWELRGEFETPLLTKRPSELFRESPIYVSLEAEELLLSQTIDYVGDDHFLYASDFPHWDAGFPKNIETLEARTDLSEATKRKILYENPKALFGL